MQNFLRYFWRTFNWVFARVMFWNWSRRLQIQFVTIVGGALALFLAIFGDKGLLELYRLKHEKAKIEKVVLAMQFQYPEYQAQIFGLKNRNAFIESSARQRLGMIAPNERVLEITKIKP